MGEISVRNCRFPLQNLPPGRKHGGKDLSMSIQIHEFSVSDGFPLEVAIVGDSFHITYNDEHVICEAGKLTRKKKKSNRKDKPGTLPKSRPELIPFLTNDPWSNIEDETADEDLATLKSIYNPQDHWQYRYAENYWKLGVKYNFLTVPQWLKRELVLQKWADDFDKVVRTDKGSESDIRVVMLWLMHFNDWWLSSGNAASPSKFHKPTKNKRFRNYFDMFLHHAHREVPREPKPGEKFGVSHVEKLCNLYKLDIKDFKKSGEGQYTYKP